jgi:hypothetical protein
MDDFPVSMGAARPLPVRSAEAAKEPTTVLVRNSRLPIFSSFFISGSPANFSSKPGAL